MKRIAVEAIVVPIDQDIPLTPSVSPTDGITDAIEVMLKNDLKRVAVVSEGGVVGMIRLEDALKTIGLEEAPASEARRSVIIHGRKIEEA